VEDALFGGGCSQMKNCVGKKGSPPIMLLKISLKLYIYNEQKQKNDEG
jgi:hypothetical protein